MAKKKWIQKAIKRPGALRAKAKKAGQSVSQFCQGKHSGRTAKQCNLAKTLRKINRKRS